jgi:hypothetical protein
MQVQVPVWRLKLPDFDLECLGNLMLHESLHGLYKPAEWLHHDVTDAGEDGGSSAAAGFTATSAQFPVHGFREGGTILLFIPSGTFEHFQCENVK